MSKDKLKRELPLWGALALSIGIMAPTNAMALNGVLPASLVGRAVPLVFLIGGIGVALVAYGFVRLTRYFSHAGSVYILAGRTLGPRAGFFGAFTLLGVYVVFAVSGFAATGLFGTTLLADLGWSSGFPWIIIAIAALIAVISLSAGEIKFAARSLLGFEGLGILLICVLIVVILARVTSNTAPNHQTLDFGAFVPPAGFTAVIGASVYAFLSWAGFEGAATLGEETNQPRRNIPLAITFSVAGLGVFFVITMFAETIGFGTSAKGVNAFANAASPFSTLATSYIGKAMADLLDLATTASAFASALACSVAAARVLFALARDGFGPKVLGRSSLRTGSPFNALLAVVGVCAVLTIGQRLVGTTNPQDVYFYYATVGVIALLVVYAVTSAGAIRYLFLAKPRRAPMWEIVLPLLSIAYLVFTFIKQVYPLPAFPYNLFPFIAAAWMLLGVIVILVRPQLSAQMGHRLIESSEPASREEPVHERLS